MCRQVTCRVCGKPTWSGCGQHREIVLQDVPRRDRCSCTDAQKAAAAPTGVFARLFGR